MSKRVLFIVPVLAIFLFGATAKIPDIGKIIFYSKQEYNALRTGCILTYDKNTQQLVCKDEITWVELFPSSDSGGGSDCIAGPLCQTVSIGCDSTGINRSVRFDQYPAENTYTSVWLTMPILDNRSSYEIIKIKFNYHGGADLPASVTSKVFSTIGFGYKVVPNASLWNLNDINISNEVRVALMYGIATNYSINDIDYTLALNKTDRLVIVFGRLGFVNGVKNPFDNYDGSLYIDSVEIAYRKII